MNLLIIILVVVLAIMIQLHKYKQLVYPMTIYIPGPDTYPSLKRLAPGVPEEWLNDTTHRVYAARFPTSKAPVAFVIIDLNLSRVVYECTGLLRIERMTDFKPYVQSVVG